MKNKDQLWGVFVQSLDYYLGWDTLAGALAK